MNSTATLRPLKRYAVLGLFVCTMAATAQVSSRPSSGKAAPPAGAAARLRAELTELLRAGQPERAIQRAQEALKAAPRDAGIRDEFVQLHLTLARDAFKRLSLDECLMLLEAVLAVQPENAAAQRLREDIRQARQRAAESGPEIECLIRIELHETALDRINEVRQLRPDITGTLLAQEQAAWLGAADDHYLAGNFNEAFALYENLLARDARPPGDVAQRWLLSLSLALAESPAENYISRESSERLRARTAEILPYANHPELDFLIRGMLAEHAGQLVEAGRAYADAAGAAWSLPPADQRKQAVAALRAKAIARAQELYQKTGTNRRAGIWSAAVGGAGRQRRTKRFDVTANNDAIAERVAEALEFHADGLCDWIETPRQAEWAPRCEVRVHATPEALRAATGTTGGAQAVSQVRTQGRCVLSRRIDVVQSDPWLLAGTLPRELARVLLAEISGGRTLPLILEDAIVVQAEPPVRRLMFRRALPAQTPELGVLLATEQEPVDASRFLGCADALGGFLRYCPALRTTAASAPTGIARCIVALPAIGAAPYWRALGWEDEAHAIAAWRRWYDSRRDPPRMPIVLSAERGPAKP